MAVALGDSNDKRQNFIDRNIKLEQRNHTAM
jgi:hypothetical protein